MRKTTEDLIQDNWSSSRDSNTGPAEYDAGVLSTWKRFSITAKTYKENIKMDREEINWIVLTQYWVQWTAPVYTVLKLGV
jgi:hypothetical protein